MQAANLVMDRLGRQGPVDRTVFPRQAMRVVDRRFVLRRLRNGSGRERVHNRDEERRADPGQVAFDLVAGFIRPDRASCRGQHRPGIQRFHDPHDRDAGFALAVDDGAVHRGRAAIAGQQRRVHVDQAETGRGENRLGEDLPVGHHDAEVGAERGQGRLKARVVHALGLKNGDAGGEGPRLDRRVGRFLTAPARPVLPRHHRDD